MWDGEETVSVVWSTIFVVWAAANFLDDVGSCIFKERFLFDPDGVSIVAIRFLRNLSSSVL